MNALDAIKAAEQELSNVDWRIEPPNQDSYAAKVGRAFGFITIARMEMEQQQLREAPCEKS